MKKDARSRSIAQKVSNEASRRRLTRDDAFVAYVMDRLLYRLGRSPQSDELYLKGGVLVANLVAEPHRFTRDIDFLRRHGPPDPDELRTRFEAITAVPLDDGITFGRVRAVRTERDVDDYDGVKVLVAATVEGRSIEVRVDVGFGDAVEPGVERLRLAPFLEGDPSATVRAYPAAAVIAEKIETVLTKFPVIAHRLNDVLDVVVLSERLAFDGPSTIASLRATFERRGSRARSSTLDDLRDTLKGRRWEVDWASMIRDKAVGSAPTLSDACLRFDTFVRPLIAALEGGPFPARWEPGGPWGVG